MSDEAGLCFVDTNVLVYALARGNSEKKRVAKELLEGLMGSDRLRVSTQILQELFVTLTRKVSERCSNEEALAVLEDLAAWPLMTVDYAAIRSAGELAGEAKISFWDALVVVSAARCGAKVLYTEDLNDGQGILGVRVLNPFSQSGERAEGRRE